mmetsp:Transcript_90812/g.261654  ORF Transcript_90812/g.261654 Transcript_90812/m.261654 type:complete len:387 (+) Transcript_90812:65-1225(+)
MLTPARNMSSAAGGRASAPEQARRPIVGKPWAEEHISNPPRPQKKKMTFEPYHATMVPKSEDLKASVTDEQGIVTTMMLRNIPNKYLQATMLQEIDDVGFAGTYDFFYLPMDVQNRSNVGYAFINFTHPAAARRFYAVFSEHRFRKYPSRKVSNVSAAHVQGLDANLRHFANRAVTHAKNGQYRPLVLQGNMRVDFDVAVAQAAARAATGCAGAHGCWEQKGAGRGREDAAKEVAGGEGETQATMEVARRGLEEALREYLLSRQVSEDAGSTTASSVGLPPSPPSPFEAPLKCLGRHSASTGLGPPSPPELAPGMRASTSPGVVLPAPPSFVDRGSALDLDSPAYLPLPTIPSASKIFMGCHGEDDDSDSVVDMPVTTLAAAVFSV